LGQVMSIPGDEGALLAQALVEQHPRLFATKSVHRRAVAIVVRLRRGRAASRWFSRSSASKRATPAV
jgi:hypothetical protein